jgi:hypothetical protein
MSYTILYKLWAIAVAYTYVYTEVSKYKYKHVSSKSIFDFLLWIISPGLTLQCGPSLGIDGSSAKSFELSLRTCFSTSRGSKYKKKINSVK